MNFCEFARVCEELEGIPGRLAMIDLISRILPTLSDEELPVFIRFIMGRIFPDWSPEKLGIGPNLLYEGIAYVAGIQKDEVIRIINRTGDVGRAVEELLGRKEQTSFFTEELSLLDVYRELAAIAATGGNRSQKEKLKVVRKLFSNTGPLEGRYLARIMLEDLRIGVGEGNVREAIARAFQVDPYQVEHAFQAINDLGKVALLAKEGESRLKEVRIELFHPVKMMLAQQGSIEEAVAENGALAAEYKYDGSRFQFHKSGATCRMYSRKLEDVTDALPDVLDLLVKATDHDVILDGEVIAIRDGRPMPFQTVLRRFRRKYGIEEIREEIRMIPNVFDLLYLDGETLIDIPLSERRSRLAGVIRDYIAPQIVSGDPAVIDRMYQEALAAGHEGLMLKVPSSPYTPGVRGKNWIKIKPAVDTLDLAVIGADWGEGKRAHLFGSFLLACQDVNGELVPLSKVATGFSDEQLQEMYVLLKDRVISESGKEVRFEPGVVVEVGYSEIQMSPNYKGGFALRFPRFIRLRDDKSLDEIETLESIRERHSRQSTVQQ
ncbi:MAG TPA: ATP-dependent DNA ligase [Methanoregulaceae archaeon]|nr:ATP-dependent DNA ligase [Methanoregulaceae archaeon]